jgi:lysophospholipase L1-like esterase
MRAIIISDSHGRRMNDFIRAHDSRWVVKLVAVGRGTSVVRESYMSRLDELKAFSPDAVLLHLGHNDVVHHPCHNPYPISSSLAFTRVMRFMDEVSRDLPMARVVYSSLFPRAVGNSMSPEEKVMYNTEACIYGEMVARASVAEHRNFVLNRSLWESPVDGLERPTLFMPDGLHLNWLGKRLVAREWMRAMRP